MNTDKDTVYKVCVHEFRMGDVDDLEIYVAAPIFEWQQTEMGKWVMEHSKEAPTWVRQDDYNTWGMLIQIHAWLSGPDLTYFNLKKK
jgi:uncharacterized protein (DUF779 family)